MTCISEVGISISVSIEYLINTSADSGPEIFGFGFCFWTKFGFGFDRVFKF